MWINHYPSTNTTYRWSALICHPTPINIQMQWDSLSNTGPVIEFSPTRTTKVKFWWTLNNYKIFLHNKFLDADFKRWRFFFGLIRVAMHQGETNFSPGQGIFTWQLIVFKIWLALFYSPYFQVQNCLPGLAKHTFSPYRLKMIH